MSSDALHNKSRYTLTFSLSHVSSRDFLLLFASRSCTYCIHVSRNLMAFIGKQLWAETSQGSRSCVYLPLFDVSHDRIPGTYYAVV